MAISRYVLFLRQMLIIHFLFVCLCACLFVFVLFVCLLFWRFAFFFSFLQLYFSEQLSMFNMEKL